MEKSGFASALLGWHAANARELPWRGEKDPYRIWLSEIMLQQTRTETVKGYYDAFLRAFPDVRTLALADEARVLKMWEGLGYYTRARNLHAAAKKIAFECGGQFPATVEGLRSLPGVGEYVAGAVASIAYGAREPALDGNQARVLSRVWNVREPLKTPFSLRGQALALMPWEDCGEYNQALMGLGALVCVPRAPRCGECPVAAYCDARVAGDPERLPVKTEKRARRVETRAIALAFFHNRVLVRKRGAGLLAGLWEFPGFPDARTPQDILQCLLEMGIDAKYAGMLPEAKHIFTHLEWHMTGFQFKILFCPRDARLATAEELEALAMPTALRVYRAEAMRLLSEAGI